MGMGYAAHQAVFVGMTGQPGQMFADLDARNAGGNRRKLKLTVV